MRRQSEDELRRELVRFGKWLYRLGYMPATSGNLSVRLDEDRLLVTPTGASKYLLRRSDMIVVDRGGAATAGFAESDERAGDAPGFLS